MSSIRAVDLRCEHLVAPLNVHRVQPRLSWRLEPTDKSARDLRQTAYQIIAGSAPHEHDLWDSGRIESDRTLIPYAGRALASSRKCFWKVRAWDANANASDWSEATFFEMGLLDAKDWKASWIGSGDSACPAPLFRKTFDLPDLPKRARAYICGLGYYELHLNGRRVGDHVLDPAQTDYESRALYVAYDVTDQLNRGDNAVAVMLGKGWYTQDRVWGNMSYGQPRLIFQLHVDDEIAVVSDASWRTTAGPVLENNVYAGETYDARREVHGDGGAGQPVLVEDKLPTKSLEPQLMAPIRRVAEIKPVHVTRLDEATRIFDLGQNFAGWVRLNLRDQKTGARIRIRTAEALSPDGKLDTASTGVFATHVEQIDTYVCKGGQAEIYEPRFTYHGFRYAEITGLSGEHADDAATGVVVHSDLEPVGTFECSDPMLNPIHAAAVWTLRSNIHGIPTDCPAREKCGWLGDAHTIAELALCNFDAVTFFDKYIRDIETSWRGNLPGDVAPGKRCSDPDGHLDWGLAIVRLPWLIYLFSGDETFLRDHYASMRKFMQNARTLAKDGILSKGYGDWCPPGSVEPVLTPPALTTTAWFADGAQIMSRVARILDRREDASDFSKLFEETRSAFNRTFYDGAKKTYGSQTANAIALEMELAPHPDQVAIAKSLRDDVIIDHQAHHTTGIFGSKFLFSALTRHGHGDAALAVLRQTTYPSFGDLFSRGATTMWECWGEKVLDDKWGARSRNHPMQAAFAAWFYQGLAGINPSFDEPGFRHVIIKPQIIEDPVLTSVRATFRSPAGMIGSGWETRGDRFVMHVEIPSNSTAVVHIPGIAEPKSIGSGAYDFDAHLG